MWNGVVEWQRRGRAATCLACQFQTHPPFRPPHPTPSPKHPLFRYFKHIYTHNAAAAVYQPLLCYLLEDLQERRSV